MELRKIMYHGFVFLLAMLLAVLVSVQIFAEDVPDQEIFTETTSSNQEQRPTETDPILSSSDSFDPDDIVSVEVHRSVNPVGPGEANGLKKLLIQLIGDYDMITAEYTYTSSNGYTSKQVTTESDYPWMITAALFILVLWSLFRFVGGIAIGKR